MIAIIQLVVHCNNTSLRLSIHIITRESDYVSVNDVSGKLQPYNNLMLEHSNHFKTYDIQFSAHDAFQTCCTLQEKSL